MTEIEANNYLKNHEKELFENNIHEKTFYAAVIKHPFKYKEYAIQVGGITKYTLVADRYIKTKNKKRLHELGFDKKAIENLMKIDNTLDSKAIIQEIYQNEHFSNEDKENVIFKFSDLNKDKYSNPEELGLSKKVGDLLKQGYLNPVHAEEVVPFNFSFKGRHLHSNNFNPIEEGAGIFCRTTNGLIGTLGSLFKFKGDRQIYGITNGHVLSRFVENDIVFLKVPTNELSTNKNNLLIEIGEVYLKILDHKSNLDVGIFKLSKSHKVILKHLSNYFFNMGNISSAIRGSKIKKFGKTTGYKEGIIQSTNATVKMTIYEEYTLRNQIMTSNIAAQGDSGSLVVNSHNNVIGLLFGGNSQVSFANHFNTIFKHKEFIKKNLQFESFINN